MHMLSTGIHIGNILPTGNLARYAQKLEDFLTRLSPVLPHCTLAPIPLVSESVAGIELEIG